MKYWSAFGFAPAFSFLLGTVPLAQAPHQHSETLSIVEPVQALPAPPALPEHWLSEGLRDSLTSPSSPPGFEQAEPAPPPAARGRVLSTTLYVTFGALQAADVYTTHLAMEGGAREANPVLRWAVGNPTALIGVKAAATVGTIYLLEKIRKRHPRAAAITIAALNFSYTAIVVNNWRLRPPSE